MPFDPAKPADGSLIVADELRDQFTALYDLIPKAATLDGVTTLPPGSSAGATVSLDSGGTLQLNDAVASATAAAVSTALAGSSNNSNAVAELGISPSDPDLSVVVQKLNELILALRR